MSYRWITRAAGIVITVSLVGCAAARSSPTRAQPVPNVVSSAELCECLSDDGRDLPFTARVCGSPVAAIGPAVLSSEAPPAPATREALIAWIEARLSEEREALEAIDRGIDDARRVRDAVWLTALDSIRSRMVAVAHATEDRRNQLPSDAAGIEHAAAVQIELARRARSLMAEARNAVAVECSCPDWSAPGATAQRAQVIVSFAMDPVIPLRLASADLSVDERPVRVIHHADDDVRRPEPAADSRSGAECSPEVLAMGLLSPGRHEIDAVLHLAPRSVTPWVEYRYPVVRVHHVLDVGPVGNLRLRVEVTWDPHATTADASLHTRLVVH